MQGNDKLLQHYQMGLGISVGVIAVVGDGDGVAVGVAVAQALLKVSQASWEILRCLPSGPIQSMVGVSIFVGAGVGVEEGANCAAGDTEGFSGPI